MAQRYVAITAPGLEPMLERELRAAKVKRPERILGGVEFDAAARGLYEVLLTSRVAHRIYLRVDSFRARDQREAYRKARRIDWERLIPPGAALATRATIRQSALYGSGALIDAVSDGIQDHFRHDLPGDLAVPRIDRSERSAAQLANTLHVMARLEDDLCQLNLEASRGSLHMRGWRAATGPAPVRESIAAAMLLAAEWTPDEPLLDPMCGSGTLLIEAARLAAGLMPRLAHHDYALPQWANFNAELWDELRAREPVPHPSPAPIFGRDLDPEVLTLAQHNAERAQVTPRVSFAQQDAATGLPPTSRPGLVVCNPPYGERLANHQGVEALCKQLDAHFRGWRACLLLPDTIRPRPLRGTPWTAATTLLNGGIPVTIWTITV